jgi:signal transduction histidine kinase
VALVAVLLATFNAFVYWGFETLSGQYMDARLHGLAQTLAELFERHPEFLMASEGEIARYQGTLSPRVTELREVLHSVQVLSLNGEVIWKGMDVLQNHPASGVVLDRVRNGEFAFETVRTPAGMLVRRIVIPLHREDEVRFALQAEASLSHFEKTHRNLMGLLSIGSVFVIGVAWLGGSWIARQVLLPVEALNRAAEEISASSLRSTVSLHVPYKEFTQLAQAFNGMLERLRKAYESQRRFVDDAAHEIQTPLTVIQGNLEWAAQKPRTYEEYREVLTTSLRHVARLITLAKSLLMLTRFGGETPPVHLAPLSLEPILSELVEDLRPLAQDRGLTLTLELEPIPKIQGDAERLKQVLINLLDNAFRYTPPGGSVTVRTSRVGDRVAIAVRDTGVGIPVDALPMIFERFYRGTETKGHNPDGVGLGLAIVKEIAQAHNGSVTVDSTVGLGSTFTLWLPAVAA